MGRRVRPMWQLQDFREVVVCCDLHDLGYQGNKYAWWNNGRIQILSLQDWIGCWLRQPGLVLLMVLWCLISLCRILTTVCCYYLFLR